MTRAELHENLVSILGSRNVYFQPPPTVQITYPAIIYHLSDKYETYSDNHLYVGAKAYSITVVDKNPDSVIPDEIAKIPLTSFSSFFMTEGLNHTVFETYIL